MNESVQARIIGDIIRIELGDNFQTLVVHYTYKTEDGVLIKSDKMILVGDEIDSLSDQVQDLLPSNYTELSEREQIMYKYFSGFKILMSETFNIMIGEIEIILPDFNDDTKNI
jgi:hypothetical protein